MKETVPKLPNGQRVNKLSLDEQKNPMAALDFVFDCYHLPELKADLWEWLVAALTTDREYRSGKERSNLLFLYDKIEILAEASYLLSQKKNVAKKKTKSK